MDSIHIFLIGLIITLTGFIGTTIILKNPSAGRVLLWFIFKSIMVIYCLIMLSRCSADYAYDTSRSFAAATLDDIKDAPLLDRDSLRENTPDKERIDKILAEYDAKVLREITTYKVERAVKDSIQSRIARVAEASMHSYNIIFLYLGGCLFLCGVLFAWAEYVERYLIPDKSKD